jgi:septin family protein
VSWASRVDPIGCVAACSGQSGLGKSTFVNTLFAREIYDGASTVSPTCTSKTVSIECTSVLLNENDVQVHLTLVDTPGFGDSIDNSRWFVVRSSRLRRSSLVCHRTHSFQPIIDFIDEQHERYFHDENKLIRACPPGDRRVHACLYFISPTGHRFVVDRHRTCRSSGPIVRLFFRPST